MSFNQAARVSAYVDDTGIFNNLPSLREANARLRFQMEKMGGDSDFATLKAIFEQHDVQSRIGLTLLHHHFEIGPGEKVVEYGNVSTPWVVPDDNRIVGRLFTGFAVPRSWRFQDGNLRPYEYGFNVEGENLYDTRELPPRFVEDVKTFLEANGLDDTLGLCTMGTSNDARVEKTIGRVSITVPMETVVQTGPPLVRSHMNDYTEAVWSFDCIAGVESSVIKLARYCLWCPDEDDC